jgi:hypothetical protein
MIRMKLVKAECSCCHGEKLLQVWDESHPERPPRFDKCGHCFGRGTVNAEVGGESDRQDQPDGRGTEAGPGRTREA